MVKAKLWSSIKLIYVHVQRRDLEADNKSQTPFKLKYYDHLKYHIYTDLLYYEVDICFCLIE